MKRHFRKWKNARARRRFTAAGLVRPTSEQLAQAASLSSPEQRARALLLLHLNERQRETYTKGRYIEVIGSAGGIYCLHSEPRVYELDAIGGSHIANFCSYVPSTDYRYAYGHKNLEIPSDDQILAHLLFLQTKEPQFRLIAPQSAIRNRRQYVHAG